MRGNRDYTGVGAPSGPGSAPGIRSVELDPRLDPEGVVPAGLALEPGTLARLDLAFLPQLLDLVASGKSIHATGVFSADHLRAALDAYHAGLERAQAAGHDISQIRAIATIDVARLDEVEAGLGAAVLALAREAADEVAAAPRFGELRALGANPMIIEPLSSPGIDTSDGAAGSAAETAEGRPDATAEGATGAAAEDATTMSIEDAHRLLNELSRSGTVFSELAGRLAEEARQARIEAWEAGEVPR